MSTREPVAKEIAALPEPLQRNVYEFALRLKGSGTEEQFNGAELSESVLARDWNSPGEDGAWQNEWSHMKQLSRCSILSVLLCMSLPNLVLAQDIRPETASGSDGSGFKMEGPLIPFSTIVTLLPKAPPGWKSVMEDSSHFDKEHNVGQTNAYGCYRKEGPPPPKKKGYLGTPPCHASINLIDSGGTRIYKEAITGSWWDQPHQYKSISSKPVVVKGYRGQETYDTDEKAGELWLMITNRFFVQIETIGLEATELQEWAKRIDLAKFATLK